MRIKKCIMLSLLFLFLLSVAGPVLVAAGPGNSNETKEQITIQRFQKAQQALIEGKWLYYRRSIDKHLNRGIQVLRQAVETLPQMADAHYYLALLYSEKGDGKQALHHANQAVERFYAMDKLIYFFKQKDPQVVDREYMDYGRKNLGYYYELRGNIFWNQKKYNEARAQYILALLRNPDIEAVYPKLVKLYFQEGSYQKAYRYSVLAETRDIKINPSLKRKVDKAAANPAAAKRKKRKIGLFLKMRLEAGFMNGGDFGRMVDTSRQYYDELIGRYNWNDITMSGGSVFKEQAAELGYQFKRFALSVELGQVSRNFRVENAVYQYHAHQEGVWDCKFSAVPVLLNVYYKLLHYSPGKSLFSKAMSADVFLLAGAGLYKGKYSENYERENEEIFSNVRNFSDESKQNTWGFHAGAALELNLWSHLSVFFQTRYRHVSFNDMYGRGEYFGSARRYAYQGELYYVRDDYYNRSFFNLGPSGEIRYTGEKAQLSLSGFSLSIGIRLSI